MSTMAMVFFIFASINSICYLAMTIMQNLLAIVQRLSEVLEMGEVEAYRKVNLPSDQAEVTLTNADLSWGYKVAQQSAKSDEREGKKDEEEKQNKKTTQAKRDTKM